MDRNTRHYVYSDGNLLAGMDKATVADRLVSAFGIDLTDAESLLSGNKKFNRTNLNHIAATDLHSTLLNAGVDVSIGIETNNALNHNKQHPINRIEPAQQDEKQVMSLTTENQIDDDYGDSNSSPQENAFIKWGGIILAASFILDGYIIDLNFLGHAGFDIGTFPYILGHTILSIGAYQFAKSKNIDSNLRILCSLSFFGLALAIYFTSNKDNSDYGGILKAKGSALFVILLSFVWAGSLYTTQSTIGSYEDLVADTRSQRSNYPDGESVDVAQELPIEKENIIEIITEGMFILEEKSLRPSQVESVAELMLESISSYIAWLHYQQYIYAKSIEETGDVEKYSEDKLEAPLSHSDIKKVKRELYNMVNYENNSDLPLRYRNVFFAWIAETGMNETQYHVDNIQNNLNEEISKSILLLKSIVRNNNGPEIPLSFVEFKFKKDIQYEIQDNLIIFNIYDHNLDGGNKNLVLYYYTEKAEDEYWKDSYRYTVKAVRVGGNLPNSYLDYRLNEFFAIDMPRN